ncbi:hypothetical protein PLANTIT3_50536 [Plantibacter sp. T3]|nr:hypothetical protein PLANTIT3_50536 [Plantibacter sp. T3]
MGAWQLLVDPGDPSWAFCLDGELKGRELDHYITAPPAHRSICETDFLTKVCTRDHCRS